MLPSDMAPSSIADPATHYNAFMPRRKVDFDTVREIGCKFPGVKPGTCYGKPALEIGGRMFCCIPSHRSVEPGSLVILVDFDRRAELLAEAAEVYYLTDHYVGYPAVLVRLSKIQPDALRGLLAGAIHFVQTQRPTRNRERKRAGGSGGPRR